MENIYLETFTGLRLPSSRDVDALRVTFAVPIFSHAEDFPAVQPLPEPAEHTFSTSCRVFLAEGPTLQAWRASISRFFGPCIVTGPVTEGLIVMPYARELAAELASKRETVRRHVAQALRLPASRVAFLAIYDTWLDALTEAAAPCDEGVNAVLLEGGNLG